ncbi:protein FAR1-RELATED SEQUENCE 5-like [Zingiber officinale]|uniref:protein FAR1-RELATED SEQUENCE 5-like n=1 Tax=Zingiber officinale TaxID=94328 RepID=UPI001C4B14E4|nr:protein FAR1-RELATED SEQUENCE 5-like [Zingiber officinale]
MVDTSEGPHVYNPQVGEDRKPQIGMEFPSLEEAFAFYNQYAREFGFSARLGNSKKNKRTNEVGWKQFVCFKEGHTDEKWEKVAQVDSVKERARGEVRTGCRAKLSLVKEQTGANWIVTKFLESHNHPLSTPSKVHFLRSHHHVSEAKKVLTQQFAEANIPTCQQVRLLEIDSGVLEFLGCTERDIRNFERELRDEQKGIDVETLIEFFATEKEKNSAFFYAYEIDSTRRFTRCFWADHVSRRAYNVFGVNHHHQSIVFGCAFLSDEKTESFVWLLTKFIESMPKGPPTVIITDQDPALTKAIGQVLPQTVHRHMLAFFRINQVFLLPDKYIFNRWTRNAKVGAIYDFGAQTSIDTPDAKLMARHSRLSYKASVVIDVASLTDEGTNMLDDQFDCIYSKLQELNISSKNDNQSQRNQGIDGGPSIVDPSLVRAKGCGKRLKSSKETTTSKARLCRGCGHRGVSHDKRNCPLLQQRSNATGKDNTNDDESYEEDLASIAVISHSSRYNALQTKAKPMQHHISLFSAPLSNMIYNYKQV